MTCHEKAPLSVSNVCVSGERQTCDHDWYWGINRQWTEWKKTTSLEPLLLSFCNLCESSCFCATVDLLLLCCCFLSWFFERQTFTTCPFYWICWMFSILLGFPSRIVSATISKLCRSSLALWLYHVRTILFQRDTNSLNLFTSRFLRSCNA